jgi:hypothetical protein
MRFFWMLLAGAVAGLALSMALVRYIEPLLYQVGPTTLPVLLNPVVAMSSAALLASIPPVIHAVTIDIATLLSEPRP